MLRPAIRRRALWLAAASGVLAAATVFLWWLTLFREMPAAPYIALAPSTELHDAHGRLLHPYMNANEQWCFPRPLNEISPYLIDATLSAEDQRYYAHGGVDTIAVARALIHNLTGYQTYSGASTLTMQVIKMGGGQDEGLWGKALQANRAARLEKHIDKATILEVYLNKAPYGQNLVGCESASRRYFGKTASELTLPEAALLAALPKSPNALMPLDHPNRAQTRRDHVLGRMRDDGRITADQYQRAIAAKLDVRWHDFPTMAPHVLASKEKTPGVVPTTLDGEIQQRVERRLKQHVASSGGQITNGAVFVVDVETTRVLARAGSADFFDTPGGGQFDAARAARSPGSALKPFTYAVAMMEQQLYPSEKLYDGPLDYGLYNPGNFDGSYVGLITASDALRKSLNVPAVALLQRTGLNPLADLLKRGGLTTLNQTPQYYGLGLTLGSCEVSLEEMTALYCAVARLGQYRPLVLYPGQKESPIQPLLPADLAAALYEMLEHPLPGDLSGQLVPTTAPPPRVAWKTGTSTGYHDAWAFVFNRQYLVAVWLGNNDGKSSPYLVGLSSAVPLAESIFRRLPKLNTPAWPDVTALNQSVEICAVSGLPATEDCQNRRRVPCPKSLYLHRVCDVHRTGGTGQLIQRWPASPARWDLARIGPLDHRPQRTVSTALTVLEPVDQAEFVLTNQPNGDIIQLKASGEPTDVVHWYVDGRYVGHSDGERTVSWKLTRGNHRITCLTDNGESASSSFLVRTSPTAPSLPSP